MPAWFYNLHVVAALLLIYGFFGFVGWIGYWLNQRYFKIEGTNSIISVAQQTGLTFGTLFIAFWIALNWQTLGDLKLASENEAHAILNLYNNTSLVENNAKSQAIRSATSVYLNSVIHDEYKSLEQGELNQNTANTFIQLSQQVYSLPTTTLQDKIVYSQLVAALNSLDLYRLNRLDYVSGQINGVLLIFLIMLLMIICFWGGCISNKNGKLTVLVMLSQYLIILSSAWLILEIDRPFQGYFKVDNSAFVRVSYLIK